MKKEVRFNHRVEVYAKDVTQLGHIASQVLRHVDGVLTSNPTFNTREVCEHCGTDWDPAVPSDDCNDCCDIEVAEWRARKGLPA